MSELHMYHFFLICACTCSTCSFVVFASAAVAHGIIVLLKKSIPFFFMNIIYKRIFLNFGVISFINKEMVSLFQLHTYKFGLVYMHVHLTFLYVLNIRGIRFGAVTLCLFFKSALLKN